MVDLSKAALAKSDQLNAVDLPEPRTIRVRAVELHENDQQKVWVYFDGDSNRPWKPSLGMRRILMRAWSTESDNWVGKYATIFNEPTVIYAGKEAGGIEIAALSHIDKKRVEPVAITRGKKKFITINPIPFVSDAEFNKKKGAVKKAITNGMTAQEAILKLSIKSPLTDEQIAEVRSYESNQSQPKIPDNGVGDSASNPGEATEVS